VLPRRQTAHTRPGFSKPIPPLKIRARTASQKKKTPPALPQPQPSASSDRLLGSATGPSILPQAGRSASDRLQISFTRYLDRNDITLTVQATDSPAGPWMDLARSTNGAAFVALHAGATITESGAANARTIVVADIYPINDPLHPTRFMRLQVTR
jgi:hypothetical protein